MITLCMGKNSRAIVILPVLLHSCLLYTSCVVNGPGEAREADIGIAGGIGEGLLFRKGEIIKKVSEDKIVDELFDEIKKILVERKMK